MIIFPASPAPITMVLRLCLVDMESVGQYVRNKRVLVTGGGGSIGSELCRQIASHNPKLLIIFDIYENNAYDIQQELVRKYPNLKLEVLIGSVRNTSRIESVMEHYRPDVVFHAAAHKHVPLMEDSPNEAIKNNVFGTYKTARAADKYGVKKFVLISTDNIRMRNCHRTSCLHLFFKQRNNASITSQHIPESYDHVFCSGIFAEGLYDHFTHTFRCTHDIGRVYCFIRRDQYKFLYPVLVRSSCCLISTKHIVFNGFIRECVGK